MAKKTIFDPAFEAPPTKGSSIAAALIYLTLLGALAWGFGAQGAHFLMVAYKAPSYKPHQATISRTTLRTEAKNSVPDIGFKYTINNKNYEGSNRYSATGFKDNRLARQHIQKYKMNAPITIFVNPKDPSKAVMSQDISKIPGIMRLTYGLIAFGVMIFSIAVFFRSIKRKRIMAYNKFLLAKEKTRRQAELASET